MKPTGQAPAAMRRYARAFWLALRLTLRGEKLPALRYPEWLAWVQQLAALVDAAYAAAERSQFDQTQRQAVRLKLDGRAMSLDSVLAALRYHARHEYPSLLRSGLSLNRLGIHASSLNDRYWLSRLLEMPEVRSSALHSELQRLLAHLDAIPSARGDDS